jgi:hypothetical protein
MEQLPLQSLKIFKHGNTHAGVKFDIKSYFTRGAVSPKHPFDSA